MEEYKIICSKLSDDVKLTREKGLCNFKEFLENNGRDCTNEYLEYSLTNLKPPHNWACILGNLTAIFEILKMDEIIQYINRSLLHEIKTECYLLLNHDEYRVRIRTGEVLSMLIKVIGAEILEENRNYVIQLLLENMNEDNKSRDPSRLSFNIHPNVLDLKITDDNESQMSISTVSILNATSGWKKLETSIRFMDNVLQYNYYMQSQFINDDLLYVFFQTFSNPNRFVRESAFQTLTTLFTQSNIENPNCWNNRIIEFVNILAKGMSDNWSQVRYAASQASRAFFCSYLSTDEQKIIYYPILLPKICLNRYYLAEGVKIYSQDTWKMVTNDHGKQLVERYIDDFVSCYVEATQADNHAVREAGCHCIAELANKIDPAILEPYAIRLIDVLIGCFKDDSWPVRDTACVASGSFITQFPSQAESYMAQFYPFLFQNLGDPIPSVRQGAALSLSKVAKAYGEPSFSVLEARIVKGLEEVDKQEAGAVNGGSTSPTTRLETDAELSSVRSRDRSPSPLPRDARDHVTYSCETSAFGVVRNRFSQTSSPHSMRENGGPKFGVLSSIHDPKHTDQTMYSCGSLAPKMRKAGGCCDTSFQRQSAYWEIADGCIYLLAELVKNVPGPLVTKLLGHVFPLLLAALHKRHYSQHIQLTDNFLKQLPFIMRGGMTKQAFKSYIEQIIEIIFYALHSDNVSARTDSLAAIKALADYLGPNILKGRIENLNPDYVAEYENAIQG